MNSRNLILGVEIDDLRGKIEEISLMGSGETWGKDRSTQDNKSMDQNQARKQRGKAPKS